jgi:hypothetical protein
MGSFLDYPQSLLEGSCKRVRHVKLRPHNDIDSGVLNELIRATYTDMKGRLRL